MKKLFIFLIIGLLLFSTTCFATSTIDYNASVSSPIYRDGQEMWGEGVTGNFSLGNSFQKSFGKIRLGGNLSGYPITDDSTRDLEEYLSLSGSIDWFEAGYLRDSLRKESFGVTYSDKFLNDNISYSVGNRWNFEDDITIQRMSLGVRKDLPDEKGTFSVNASWSTEDLKRTNSATVTVAYSGSFHYSGGERINTSIIPEVFLEDKRPVSGVTINLLVDGEIVKKVKTSQGGTASFGELEPGDYKVQLVVSSLPEEYELISSREVTIQLAKNDIRKARFELNESEIEERTTFSGSLDDE